MGFDRLGAISWLGGVVAAAVLVGATFGSAPPTARAQTPAAAPQEPTPQEDAAALAADLDTLRGYRFGQLRGMRVHEAPEPAFAVPFFGPDGAETSLDAFEGKVRLVNFWATWCAPCLKEMPSIDRLVGALEAEGIGDRVEVIAISVDRGDRSRPAGWLAREGLERLGLYHDPENDVSVQAKLRGMPTTLIIGAQGRELARLEGPAEWDGAEVVAMLRALAGADG